MSEREKFLERWARRKREASEESNAPTESPRVPDKEAHPTDGKPRPPGEAGQKAPPEATFDIASLPPLDSITAASDVRAFLAPGVPLELTRAALRRAWSADPAIRDYIGLSEYSWDFNAPGSMAGFEPLRPTDDVKKLLAEVFGDDRPAADRSTADRIAALDPETSQASSDTRTAEPVEPHDSETAIASSGRNAPEEAGGADISADGALAQTDPLQRGENVASQNGRPSQQLEPGAARRRHGSALPKV